MLESVFKSSLDIAEHLYICNSKYLQFWRGTDLKVNTAALLALDTMHLHNLSYATFTVQLFRILKM